MPTTDEILDAVDTKEAYVQFGDTQVRISESEATRIVQELGDNVGANMHPGSVVLFIPDGANTGVPTGGLPSQDDLAARKKLVDLYNAVSGNGTVTLSDPKETRYDQVVTDLYVTDGDLVAKLTSDETETLTGLTRFFSSHFEATTIQEMIDDVNAQ